MPVSFPERDRESAVFLEFLNLTVFPESLLILFHVRDDSSMLDEKNLAEVSCLFFSTLQIERIGSRVRASLEETGDDGLRGCSPLCHANLPFHLLKV